MHGTSERAWTDNVRASKPKRSAQANATVSAPGAKVMPDTQADRTNDTLLTFDEVSELMRQTEATLRWKRNRGEAPFLFRMDRRLYAWKNDCLAHIEAQRLADQETRQLSS